MLNLHQLIQLTTETIVLHTISNQWEPTVQVLQRLQSVKTASMKLLGRIDLMKCSLTLIQVTLSVVKFPSSVAIDIIDAAGSFNWIICVD